MAKKTKARATKRAKAKPARRPATRTASAEAAPKAAAGPSMKQQFLETFRDEHARTLKVLGCFPAEQGGFRPHPRSSSATQLAWTFAIEQGVIDRAIRGTLNFGAGGMPAAPPTFREAVAAFEQGFKVAESTVKATSESKLGAPISFPAGPGKMVSMPVINLMWMMVMDQVHHRGQLSVYNRMAGGKVPSIYGPSADEPWS